MFHRLFGAIALVSLVAAAPAGASGDKAGSDIANWVLGNGLEIVVIPDRRAPVVTQMIWYKVGSADEEPGKSGIAHFFEHLMFKATKNHPQGEFSRRIAEIGGQENAFTSYDYTAYYQQVAPEALPDMMRFEADRMRNLVLTDDVIGTERDVVLEERRSRVESEPGALLGEEVDATLYQNHPYRLPVIGWMHEIEKLNRKDAVDFYDRFYAPNNAVLVVAGDVAPETVKALAEETYGKVPRGPDFAPRLRPSEPEQNTRRTVALEDPRVSVPSMRRAWLVPSYTTGEGLEAEALDLLSEILGGGPQSRLYEALVVEKGLASSVGAWFQGDALDQTSFEVYASQRGEGTIEEVEAVIEAEIGRIAEAGVTEKELASAKMRFLRSAIFARDSQSGMARIYGTTLTTGGTVKDVEEWSGRIEQVSSDDVKQAASRYLVASRSVTGYLLPSEKKS